MKDFLSVVRNSSGWSILGRFLLPHLKGSASWPYGRLLLCNLLRLVELSLSLSLPFVLQKLFEAFYTQAPNIRWILALYSLLVVTRSGFHWIVNVTFFTLVNTAVRNVRFSLIEQGHRVNYELYSHWHLGDTLSCLQRLRSSLGPSLRVMGLNGLTHSMAYVIGCGWLGYKLGWGYAVLMVLASLMYLTLYWYGLSRYAYARQKSWSYTDFVVHESLESLSASESLRPYATATIQHIKNFFFKEAHLWYITTIWSYSLSFLASSLCTLGVWVITDATLLQTSSLFIVVHQLFKRTFQAFHDLAHDAKTLIASLADFRKIAEFLDQPPDEISSEIMKPNLQAPAAFRIENLTFSYQNAASPLLENIFLTMPSNYKLLLSGPNGSGKSTLLKLIAGLLKAQQGCIFWGTACLNGTTPQQRTPWIYRLPQEPVIHPCSPRSYLNLGLDIDDSHIWEALNLVGLDKLVQNWPQQLATPLTSTGNVHLSGGQKQRLALARAWLAKPSLLLLDEAISAIDPSDSLRILENLWQRIPQIICVTHHPYLLPRYDAIFSLDHLSRS